MAREPGERSNAVWPDASVNAPGTSMDFELSIVWILVGAAALAVGAGALASYFSAESRAERRRRRSNARIVSKSNRPTVKFSVRIKKD